MSFLFVCLSVSLFVYVECICTRMYMHICVEAGRQLRVLFCRSAHPFLHTESLRRPKTHPINQAGWQISPRDLPVSASSAEIISVWACAALYEQVLSIDVSKSCPDSSYSRSIYLLLVGQSTQAYNTLSSFVILEHWDYTQGPLGLLQTIRQAFPFSYQSFGMEHRVLPGNRNLPLSHSLTPTVSVLLPCWICRPSIHIPAAEVSYRWACV